MSFGASEKSRQKVCFLHHSTVRWDFFAPLRNDKEDRRFERSENN